MISATAAPMLSVSELKQFVYCPRIFYFMSVQPLSPPRTHLMDRGHRLQEEFERLEPRRVLSGYGFAGAARHFSVALKSASLSLAGQADLVLESENRIGVVEFKASAGQLAENHRMQLAVYALMAEEEFHKPCPLAFAIFVDREEMDELPVDEALRAAARAYLDGMAQLLARPSFPDPTPVRARCTNCEFKNFCGDVF